jgi:hypothetical protein
LRLRPRLADGPSVDGQVDDAPSVVALELDRAREVLSERAPAVHRVVDVPFRRCLDPGARPLGRDVHDLEAAEVELPGRLFASRSSLEVGPHCLLDRLAVVQAM